MSESPIAVYEVKRPYWAHHAICGALVTKAYTFKIWEAHLWKGDGGPYEFSLHVDGYGTPRGSRAHETGIPESEPQKIETEDDLNWWIESHNAFHSRWIYRGQSGYCRKTPEEMAVYKPVARPVGMRRRVLYCVVAQTSAHKKDWDGFPNGLFFYPKDRESRAECEEIVAGLKRDLEALP